jgi:hypothetical protein
MKHLIIAFGISVVLAVVIYAMGRAIVGNDDLVKTAAFIPFAGCRQIAELLEKHEAKRELAAGKQGAVRSPVGYAIPWPLAAAYGTIIIVAIKQGAAYLATSIFAAAGLDNSLDGVINAALVIDLLVSLFAAYFIGRWISVRSRGFGIISILVAVMAGTAVAVMIDAYFLSADEIRKMFGFAISTQQLFASISIQSTMLLIPALFGYWRGKQLRKAKYLEFLLAILPTRTQDLLVELAFQEAGSLAKN